MPETRRPGFLYVSPSLLRFALLVERGLSFTRGREGGAARLAGAADASPFAHTALLAE